MRIVIILFFLLSTSSFAQLTQFWNYQNQENTATKGLFYKHEVTVWLNFLGSNTVFYEKGMLGSYSTYLEKYKIGLGVNFENFSSVILTNNKYNVWI